MSPSVGRGSGSWLPSFASRIAPDFVALVGSSRFSSCGVKHSFSVLGVLSV
jgi:hypothetical protein